MRVCNLFSITGMSRKRPGLPQYSSAIPIQINSIWKCLVHALCSAHTHTRIFHTRFLHGVCWSVVIAQVNNVFLSPWLCMPVKIYECKLWTWLLWALMVSLSIWFFPECLCLWNLRAQINSEISGYKHVWISYSTSESVQWLESQNSKEGPAWMVSCGGNTAAGEIITR